MDRRRLDILITGGCGLLGAHLVSVLSHHHNVLIIDRHPWWGDEAVHLLIGDLEDSALVDRALAGNCPDVLIHCAAMIDVEACERDPAQAFERNESLTRRLADRVAPHCLFVYISTDGLFGEGNVFATETTPPCPQTVYARSKLCAEQAVDAASSNHLIVRTNFYGWSSGRRLTSAEWMFRALGSREPLTFFDDLYTTPIYVTDLAERLKVLIESNFRGVFHLGGRDRVSKYRFGELMAQAAALPFDHIRRGSLNDAPFLARRPKDMSLSSDRFTAATGLNVPGCVSGLRRFIDDREIPLSRRCRIMQVPR